MKKILTTLTVSSVVFLAGCAANASDSDLSAKVAQLTNEVATLKANQTALMEKVSQNATTANAAQEEAQRANERIDHIARSYTK